VKKTAGNISFRAKWSASRWGLVLLAVLPALLGAYFIIEVFALAGLADQVAPAAGPTDPVPTLAAWQNLLLPTLLLWLLFALFALLVTRQAYLSGRTVQRARARDFFRQLEQLTRNLPGFVYQLQRDPNGRWHYPYASEGVRKIFGVTPEEVTADAATLLGRIHPDDYHRVMEESLQSASHLEPWVGRFRMIHHDGRLLWIESRDTAQKLPDGSIIWTGYANDITEYKELEEALRTSEATFRAYVENANDIIYAVSPEGVLTYVSPNWTEILGHELAEVVNRKFDSFTYPEDLPSSYEFLRNIAVNGQKQEGYEYRIRHRNGEWRWHTANASPLFDEQGKVIAIVGITRDITERKQAEARITRMAHYDALTDLPNRSLFVEMAQHALATARRQNGKLALLFVDLDNFKPVNDQYGHAVGDLLLQQVARRLTGCLRAADQVGRISGDEFIVLLHTVDRHPDAFTAADKIRAALHQPFMIEERNLQISASIGIAVFPDHGGEIGELLRHADHAMYQAKEAGRNTARLFMPDQPPLATGERQAEG